MKNETSTDALNYPTENDLASLENRMWDAVDQSGIPFDAHLFN